MNATKKRSTKVVLIKPGEPVKFEMYDAALTMAAQSTPCGRIRIDYVCTKRIPPLLDVQKN
jgi:hypothetical protein